MHEEIPSAALTSPCPHQGSGWVAPSFSFMPDSWHPSNADPRQLLAHRNGNINAAYRITYIYIYVYIIHVMCIYIYIGFVYIPPKI